MNSLYRRLFETFLVLLGNLLYAFVLIFNAVMFAIGFFVFRWKFAANTLISTVSYPIALELIMRIANGYPMTDDLILCTAFCL